MKTVGRFTFEAGAVSGPAEYMAERGNALLEACLTGKNVVFNYGLTASPDPETALMVALQTDYAAYAGMKGLEAMRGRRIDSRHASVRAANERANEIGYSARVVREANGFVVEVLR